jgi:NitT/TauT family transport system permease protein
MASTRGPRTRPARAGRREATRGEGTRRAAAAVAAVLGILLAWKAAAAIVGKEIVLPSPERVLAEAASLFPTPRFLSALLATFLRGVAAFGLSALLGAAAGLASGARPLVAAALAPILTVIRATPVLALVLIALLWFPSGFVPIFSAFLMAFPVMATSAAEGVRAADARLVEMSSLFRVPSREVFLKLRLPAAAPHLIAGAKNALGLTWKVVVAGEILSQPRAALGTGMQESRVLLESAGVFAWAVAAIALCGLTEWLLGMAADKAAARGL